MAHPDDDPPRNGACVVTLNESDRVTLSQNGRVLGHVDVVFTKSDRARLAFVFPREIDIARGEGVPT